MREKGRNAFIMQDAGGNTNHTRLSLVCFEFSLWYAPTSVRLPADIWLMPSLRSCDRISALCIVERASFRLSVCVMSV